MSTLELIYPRLSSRVHLRSSGVAQWTLCGQRLDPRLAYGCQIARDAHVCLRCILRATERGFACSTCRVIVVGQAAQSPCPRCAAAKAT
jgi:hypothetical protein